MLILIVDDEREIGKGLSNLIRQKNIEGLNIEIAAVCTEAKKALSILSSQKVDLVITDVKMPDMSGLQLMEIAKKLDPGVDFVVLSGYADFSYVQKALKLGAGDYLLKPVIEDDLFYLLKRMVQKREEKMQNKLAVEWSDFVSYEPKQKMVLVMDIYRNDSCTAVDGNDQILVWQLQKEISEFIEERTGLCSIKDNIKNTDGMIIGLFSDTTEKILKLLEETKDNIIGLGEKNLRIGINIGVSQVMEVSDSAYMLYWQACNALVNRILKKNTVFTFNEMEKGVSSGVNMDLNRLYSYWDISDLSGIINEVKLSINNLIVQKSTSKLVRGIYRLMFSLLGRAAQGIDNNNGKNAVEFSNFLLKLLWSRDQEILTKQILDWINGLFTKMESEKIESNILSRVKQYIRAHIHEQISLSEVAKAVYVSPNYISRLFRQQAGVTFIEYLTDLRIAEAKNLLERPDIKVYEVAEKAGYTNWKHFSRTFKGFTGINPSEYRSKYYPDS